MAPNPIKTCAWSSCSGAKASPGAGTGKSPTACTSSGCASPSAAGKHDGRHLLLCAVVPTASTVRKEKQSASAGPRQLERQEHRFLGSGRPGELHRRHARARRAPTYRGRPPACGSSAQNRSRTGCRTLRRRQSRRLPPSPPRCCEPLPDPLRLLRRRGGWHLFDRCPGGSRRWFRPPIWRPCRRPPSRRQVLHKRGSRPPRQSSGRPVRQRLWRRHPDHPSRPPRRRWISSQEPADDLVGDHRRTRGKPEVRATLLQQPCPHHV